MRLTPEQRLEIRRQAAGAIATSLEAYLEADGSTTPEDAGVGSEEELEAFRGEVCRARDTYAARAGRVFRQHHGTCRKRRT